MSEKPGNDLLETIILMMSGLADWYERNEPAIQRFASSAMNAGDGLFSGLAVLSVTFNRGGWSDIPLRSMELLEAMKIMQELAHEPDEVVTQRLDVWIPEYFGRNDYEALREMVEEWGDHFPDRFHIFEDALWAHTQGRYTLSIPALAAQMEGIIRNLVGDFDRGSKWRKKFVRGCETELRKSMPDDQKRNEIDPETKPETGKNDPKIGDLASIMRTHIAEIEKYPGLGLRQKLENFRELENRIRLLSLLRLRDLFSDKKFSDPDAVSVINRHVILHGIFTKFEEKESLQMFFAIDLLREAAEIYKTEKVS